MATRVENIHDIPTLQEFAKLQEREIISLHTENHRLQARINTLEGKTDVQPELLQLKDLLQLREDALFGDSSEKRGSEEKDKSSKKKDSQTGHGPTAQPELDLVDQT